jgi:hypothetical protein
MKGTAKNAPEMPDASQATVKADQITACRICPPKVHTSYGVVFLVSSAGDVKPREIH